MKNNINIKKASHDLSSVGRNIAFYMQSQSSNSRHSTYLVIYIKEGEILATWPLDKKKGNS
jgi:hypothetical protein